VESGGGRSGVSHAESLEEVGRGRLCNTKSRRKPSIIAEPG
jgi:hypothetical protein